MKTKKSLPALGKRAKEKYHSYKGKVGKVAENIINRDFNTTAPVQKWTTYISQFSFSWGKCYLLNGYHKSAVLKTPIKKVDYDTIHKRIQRTGNFIV